MSQNQLAIIQDHSEPQAVEGPVDALGNLGVISTLSTPDDYIGKDWAEKPSGEKEALLDYEYRHLRTDILANVRFIGPLGKGAFGQVWEVSAQLKVKDEYPSESVWKRLRLACKIIRHKDIDETSILDSLNEMRTLRYLRHQNICNLIDLIGIPDRNTRFPFSKVVMFFELCDGNFDDLLKGFGVLPERLSRHWFAQITKAIQYLHSNGVIHNDLHKANILYCRPDDVYQDAKSSFLSTIFKLADFGLSRDAKLNLNPEIYKWTVPLHRYFKNKDIEDLLRILYETGVPEIEVRPISSGGAFNPNTDIWIDFFDYCQMEKTMGTDVWKSYYPLQWKQLSSEMKDLLYRLQDTTKKITSTEILRHPWLQANDEPRTEPFIWRKGTADEVNLQFEVQPSYRDWENARRHPSLYPDFESPFGKVQRPDKEFDPISRQWITAYDPIQGVPNMHELIDSFANN